MTPQEYIQQGFDVAQAGREAYQSTPGNLAWPDSWINFAMDYAKSKYEFDQNKEMWQLMNEYNTPANQMARFKEAGLNPNLIYSQGTPGNVANTPQYQIPNNRMTPGADKMNTISQISAVVDMITNMTQNVMAMYDSSLDLQMKRNEVDMSNWERSQNAMVLPGFGGGRDAQGRWMSGMIETLNPFSSKFDPNLFHALQRNGRLPEQYMNMFFELPKKDYTEARTRYQKYYNEHLLPKFDAFQQGKIDLQEFEKELEEYNKQAREMIPPSLRGILEPVIQFLTPLFKIVFKTSRGKFQNESTVTVK